ncbi:MAG: DUF5305 domain-containing protein [Bacilli bacterium]|nr:DUF5305 domain-containing protein [Bacilli bacterium]
MKKKNESKIIIKQWVRVFLLIIVISVMVTSIISVVRTLNPEVVTKKKLYSYNYTADMNYRVYIKPNNFYTAPYMGMNKSYIASLIDHLEVDAKYNFKSTEEIDYTYNYSIVATARGMAEDSDGKDVDVWSKEYPLVNLESNSGSGSEFSIAKTVNIDYNTYNRVLTSFREQFGLSVDARVDLAVKINVTGALKGSGENTLQESQTMTLKIPLLVQTFKITPDYVNSGGDTVYSKVTPNKQINIPLLVGSVALLLISFVIFIKLVKSLLVVTRKSEYVLAINKIFKEYADVIAETHNMPDLNKYDVVNIKNFADMVDIEEELHSPIIYFEIEENTKCVFLILHENTAYRFLMRESDFSHFGNNKDSNDDSKKMFN